MCSVDGVYSLAQASSGELSSRAADMVAVWLSFHVVFYSLRADGTHQVCVALCQSVIFPACEKVRESKYGGKVQRTIEVSEGGFLPSDSYLCSLPLAPNCQPFQETFPIKQKSEVCLGHATQVWRFLFWKVSPLDLVAVKFIQPPVSSVTLSLSILGPWFLQ